jgi:hypothetical protein
VKQTSGDSALSVCDRHMCIIQEDMDFLTRDGPYDLGDSVSGIEGNRSHLSEKPLPPDKNRFSPGFRAILRGMVGKKR